MVRLLDLFCGAGGCSVGYHRAGFEVVGVDINPQPNYPFEFHQADAMTFPLDGFDAIHASPPCQAYSRTGKLRGNDHPDLVAETRERLTAAGLPYVIENVEGAPLIDPITIEGQMFPELRTSRPRLFETNWPITQPTLPPRPRHTKMGRKVKPGEFMHVVGNFNGADDGRKAMGIDWMTRKELAQAIPPAYTELIGRQLVAHLEGESA
jgi:DNA (cytosine-5)-methyltransferase 1